MDEKKEALGLLENATMLVQKEIEPPRSLYWYKPPFFQMNIGMVYWELGENQMAADFLSSGLGDLPEDQQGAEWTHEYREVLSHAERGR